MQDLLLIIVLSPLIGSALSGLLGSFIGRRGAHTVTILSVALSCALSFYLLKGYAFDGWEDWNGNVYTWLSVAGYSFHVGFLIDGLTVLMMSVVTFVSLMVHIYTIAYMHDDPGYQRFFSYISLFTFSMLMLVMANNFVQLFFGWEAVGLVSYLLIGFWYKKETAIFANLKAFLVNRVGDFGFLLGIAAVLMYFGTLDYASVFALSPTIAAQTIEILPGQPWALPDVIGILLFIGAMGKSAQVPLHVWLPDSMEGPTPISALIHAATMVTAGIFMVARMSPLYEMAELALSFILVVGSITALFMGLVGIVQNDIKRVVAYSTLSQLGYMTVALGASAYSVAIFHLMTHAFFKALLFLAAGSVIMGMHHQQDMQKMGGLRKLMPVTFLVAWIGSLALVGFPGTSGFFSKDLIIEAVHHSERAGAGFAYFAVLGGVLITSLYSFRLLYLTFHGQGRMDEHTKSHVHESPLVVTIPLLLLAIPSLAIGWYTVDTIVFGDFLSSALVMDSPGNPVSALAESYHGPWGFVLHGLAGYAFYMMLAGFVISTFVYLFKPSIASSFASSLSPVYRLLENKFYIDELYFAVFVKGGRGLGNVLWRAFDISVIDTMIVNGSARLVSVLAGWTRRLQTGRLYHYAFGMILGFVVLVVYFIRTVQTGAGQ